MKIAISLPDELFDEAEQVSTQMGMSRSQLYATALEQFIRQRNSIEITKRLNEVYSERPLTADESFDSLGRTTLARTEWE